MKDILHIVFFYINRFLRLIPLYAVIAGLTYAFLSYRGGLGFIIDPTDPRLNYVSPALLSIPILKLAQIEWGFGWKFLVDPFPSLVFSPNLIPQGWSIGVELCFYLFAPLSVWLCRRRLYYLAFPVVLFTGFFIYGMIISPNIGFMDNFIYKNFLASIFMFLFGGLLYFLSERVTFRFGYVQLLAFLVLWLGYVWVWSASPVLGAREPDIYVLAVNLLLTGPVTALVVFTKVPEWAIKFDSAIGNLSYGIYLNQFLVAYLLLLGNEVVEENYGIFRFFGRVNTWEFGLYAAVASAILAMLFYYLIERPVDKLRVLLKNR